MIDIVNIRPHFITDKNGIRKVSYYQVDFKTKKDHLEINGSIDYTGDISDFSAIQGKIAYELKNISNGF